MISGCLKSLSDQVKAEVNEAKRDREDRLIAKKEVEVKLDKLRQGSFIKDTEEALSKHLSNICQQVKSYLLRDEVSSTFCTWEEKDLPEIDDNIRGNVEKLKKIYIQCVEQRLEKFLQKRRNNYSLRLALTLRRGFVEDSSNLKKTYETSIRSLLANPRTKYYCNLKSVLINCVLPWMQGSRNSSS